MISRLILIAFYAVSVSLFSAYIHICTLFDQILLDSVPTRSYEYIIVGAGTAGLTVAAGLHSDSVLHLEAGASYTGAPLDIPMLTPLLQRTGFDWGYETTDQQPHACGALRGHRSRWPMGRGFGGSQILNNMMWTRGHRDDYRGWFGAPAEYDYARDVEPHFRAAEQQIELTQLPHHTPLASAFVNASREFGYTDGFYIPHVTQRNGWRYTNAHRHRQRDRPRRGHDTVLGAHVLRLLFDDDDAATSTTTTTASTSPKCTGLVYERSGHTVHVTATRGVILSAGTIGSPLILQASGIGPRELLVNATATASTTAAPAVRLRRDLAGVGRNLQDHVTTGVDLLLVREPLGVRPWDVLTAATLYRHLVHGDGPLTMCGCEAIGFVNTTTHDLAGPNIGFMVLPMGASADGGAHFRHLLNIEALVWSRYFEPLIGQHTASILPIVLHPRSRGTVQLALGATGAPAAHINPGYLADESDVETLVIGLRILEQMLEMPALRRLGVELNPQPFPGCGHLDFRSTRYWRCYVRQLTLSAFHPVGTCRMGDAADEMAVVGRDYRVHGVQHLWVVDASVMPNLPSANPNAAVAMLASRFVAVHRRAESV